MQYHNTIDAIVYDQTAAESYAMYVQCFTLARMCLDRQLEKRKAEKADPASFYLVTDCDETVLDNGVYNAGLIETGRDFHDDTWRQWCRAREATDTPGAVDFMKYAQSKGVRVCYVSSRFEDTRDDTAFVLKKNLFPLDNDTTDPTLTQLFLKNMLINGVKTSKKEQFEYLKQRFGAAPVLQLGDNLSDLDAVKYDSKVRYDVRGVNAEQDKTRFGVDWIAFPNSVYGGWRQSLKYKSGDTDLLVTDEPIPVPFQPKPVRPTVTTAEAPKMSLLKRWTAYVGW